jgi:RimJ/RimL family protein N-acetyltransferase
MEPPVLRWCAECVEGGVTYRVAEPDDDALVAAAPLLARWYDHPENRALLTNQQEFTPAAVLEHYAAMRAAGARTFLFYRDGALAGDGDLRGFARPEDGPEAEYALLVGEVGAQGRGLGTLFSRLVLHLAFGPLGLSQVFASVVPQNKGSLRMFEKLGFVVDASPAGRRYAEHGHDVCLRMEAGEFARLHGAQTASVRVAGLP